MWYSCGREGGAVPLSCHRNLNSVLSSKLTSSSVTPAHPTGLRDAMKEDAKFHISPASLQAPNGSWNDPLVVQDAFRLLERADLPPELL